MDSILLIGIGNATAPGMYVCEVLIDSGTSEEVVIGQEGVEEFWL